MLVSSNFQGPALRKARVFPSSLPTETILQQEQYLPTKTSLSVAAPTSWAQMQKMMLSAESTGGSDRDLQPSHTTSPLKVKPYEGHPVSSGLMAKFSRDEVAQQRLDLKAVEHYEQQFSALHTPAEFQAQTLQLKQRLAEGATLEEVRSEAFALARQAAHITLGKRPYDSQMLGALAMDPSCIAQMGTGEGKTLTALMPLYLNALAGKGSHLVTVNDYLAQAGFDELKAVFQTLGLKPGLVLKDMTPEQKRAGYAADVTYLSNDTLGFDYLADRTAKREQDRVQRDPYFALLDEADQVLLDEALVPLIIAGEQPQDDLAEAKKQGQLFAKIVSGLVPGEDFQVDIQARAVSLTEMGQDILANELAISQLSFDDPSYADKLAAGVKLRQVIRSGAGETERQPYETLLPPSNIYGQEQESAVSPPSKGADISLASYLHNALQARFLFFKGQDYSVGNGQVQIIDEFKGRISEGRRFMQGLHQALEIKEGLDPRPETRTLASITYPNLFRRYDRLAGMTGSASSARQEFSEALGLETIVVPPNRPSQRVDRPDAVFATQKQKLEALVAEAQSAFEEGTPVLLATRSVKMNRYLSDLLTSRGIANQSLNAEDVKTNTPEENALVAQAGHSGVVTVATNMAGRGVDIKPDPINYKKLAIAIDQARQQGQTVVVELEKAEQIQRLAAWLQSDPADPVAFRVADPQAQPAPGEVLLRVGGSDPIATNSATLLKSSDFPGKKLIVLASEHNLERRIDEQLKGRAGRQGAPGETQFFVSLEDELLRNLPAKKRQELADHLEQGDVDAVRQAVITAQENLESSNADARFSTARIDAVVNQQREIFWGFRDAWLADKTVVESTLPEWTKEVVCQKVEALLHGSDRPSSEELRKALRAAIGTLGMGPDQARQLADRVDDSKGPWREQLESAVRGFLASSAHQPSLAQIERSTNQTLETMDAAWTEHLQALEVARDNSRLQTFIGKDPEQAFKEEAYLAFDQMWTWIKESTVIERLQTAGQRDQKSSAQGAH